MEVAGLNVDVMVKKVYGEGDEGGGLRVCQAVKLSSGGSQ